MLSMFRVENLVNDAKEIQEDMFSIPTPKLNLGRTQAPAFRSALCRICPDVRSWSLKGSYVASQKPPLSSRYAFHLKLINNHQAKMLGYFEESYDLNGGSTTASLRY